MRVQINWGGWHRVGSVGMLMATLLMGCGGDNAPDTYHVSGTVNFDGKPIPVGQIRFVPDSSKGNSGPAGYAQIIDGKYDTSAESGKGHASGPMIVQIDGQDPESKSTSEGGEEIIKSLFPTYQATADLPKEDTTKDFDVPAEAADVKYKSEESLGGGGGP